MVVSTDAIWYRPLAASCEWYHGFWQAQCNTPVRLVELVPKIAAEHDIEAMRHERLLISKR